MISTIKSYVGYAIRSRNALFGVNNITSTFGVKLPQVILYDALLSENSKEKLLLFANRNGIKVFCVDIEDIYPNKNCKAIGIKEKNLSTAIIKEMEEFSKWVIIIGQS